MAGGNPTHPIAAPLLKLPVTATRWRAVEEDGVVHFTDLRSYRAMYHASGFDSRDLRAYAVNASGTTRIECLRTSSLAPGMPVTVSFPFAAGWQGSELWVLESSRLLSPRDLRNSIIYGFKRSFFPDSYDKKRRYVRQIIDFYDAIEREFEMTDK